MRFTIDEEYYRVSHVTGPGHHFLGLGFSRHPVPQIVVQALRANVGCSHAQHLSEVHLREAIEHAVAEANTRFRVEYYVNRIQYVPNESENFEMYGWLAGKIIERLATIREYTGST